MSPNKEIILDYDRTVDTEKRFIIRRFLDSFVEAVNAGDRDELQAIISDGITVEGFTDFVILKQNYIGMLLRKFGKSPRNYMRFPILKLTYRNSLYKLNGTYEEFIDNILVTEGTVDLQLITANESYQIIKIKLYPRMKLQDELND